MRRWTRKVISPAKKFPSVTAATFSKLNPSKVHYMDVSPKQLVSVAAGLIPFLEHDDANRALMGSNMQRQGVPLIVSEAPLVGTGLEGKVARDSRAVVVAAEAGRVASVTADQIVVTKDGEMPEGRKKLKTDLEAGVHVYELRKFMRSNAGTCVNQKPIVKKGQHVKRGQVIADGPNTEHGELALGRNVLVAFMPWNGYNFEDAIMISEKVVKEDIYTSIHIDEFEIGARDTKLGPEEITRDIPNVSEEALRNLGSGRRDSRRRGSEAGRHPGRQNHSEERDGTGAGRAPAPRDLRRKGGRRERHVADRSIRHLRHRDGRESFIAARGGARKTDAGGNEAAAQGDRGRQSEEEGRTDGTTHRRTLQCAPRRENPARRRERADRRNHHPGQSQDHQDAAP